MQFDGNLLAGIGELVANWGGNIQANWTFIVAGVILLVIPSPCIGLFRKFAKKIGMRLSDDQSDKVIGFLGEIVKGLKESQYENNDGKVPTVSVEEAIEKIEKEIKNIEGASK